jgi:hypothetical protein
MTREPDWEALADLQFLLYNRIADSLNAALTGIALSDMPEAQDKPPGFWKERASTKIANVLNLFTAWSYLVRFKMGESIPERAVRPFEANALLQWLGSQLQLVPAPEIATNPLLYANRETLQEALLLLYSAAYTQGTNVRFELQAAQDGLWFRVQFTRAKPLPETFDALLASFGDHWRDQDTVFELATARDFVRLNECDLVLNSSTNHGEFAFFVQSAAAHRKRTASAAAQAAPPEPAQPAPVVVAPPAPTPVMVVEETTPVIPESEPEPAPPSLAELRPRPHIPAVPAPQPLAAEGAAPPGEPEEDTSQRDAVTVTSHSDDTQTSQTTQIVRLTPPSTQIKSGGLDALAADQKPRPAPEPPEPQATIVPLKIPDPKPPLSLRKPPASTSNVALTKKPQPSHPPKTDAPAESSEEAP